MVESDILALRKFVAPEIVYGAGALDLAGQYAANLGAGKVLLVSDEGVAQAGWTGLVAQSLREAGLPLVLFTDVSPNPRTDEVMAGTGLFEQTGCDAIVAVGGGSPMDCAKGIGIVAANGGHILDYEGADKVEVPIPPLICLPTTAGSSADVSQFCIISNLAKEVKIAIVSKAVVPDVALIDSLTTTTMDPYLTACTGLDALTHAVEAYVSTANSPLTDLHALEAIRLISQNLVQTVQNPRDKRHRGRMMLASLEAGLAFSNAILGAVHALAHSLGGFLDLPHGECNAILLEHVVAYNFPAARPRYRQVAAALGVEVQGLLDDELLAALVARLRNLREACGVTRTLRQLGVGPQNLGTLAEMACADVCLVTNPRPAQHADVVGIYQNAL
ncbi:MAG: iron-containing alcohol dehydrogenase [Deltaproteobacteria bacterium]|nr:iron-containing alcohol dehydrogenase [Deltaproteobacteria bacterium]